MKKVLIIGYLLCMGLHSVSAYGQDANAEVRINFLALRYSNFNLSYEHYLSPIFSVEATVGARVNSFIYETNFEPLYFRPEFRYYQPGEDWCSGYFAGIYLKARQSYDKFDGSAYGGTTAIVRESLTFVGGGLNLGRKWKLGDLSIELNLGLGNYFYRKASYSRELESYPIDTEDDLRYLEWDLRLGIGVGYRFLY